MNLSLPLLIVAGMASAATLLSQDSERRIETTEDRSGRVVEKIRLPNSVKGYATIHYPRNFQPSKRYHILYWFHGTSGNPGAGISSGHEEYIGVGMSYLERDSIAPGQYGKAHWLACLEIRNRYLVAEKGLSLGRNLVAGVSKGGWMAFYIGSEPRNDLHGIAIIAAGRDPNVKGVSDLKATDLSVLVATGETDPNYPQAQLAVEYFRKAGAPHVFYEEWGGEGHTVKISPRVVHWLEVESMRGNNNDLLQLRCEQSITKRFDEVMQLPNPRDQYVELRRLMGDPRAAFVGPDLVKKIRETGRSLSQDANVTKWTASFTEFQNLVRREVKFFESRNFEVAKLGGLVERYREMAVSGGFPDTAARAAYGYLRTEKMKKIYEAQLKSRENPEYRALVVRNAKLQKLYSDAGGEPGPEIMRELQDVGARLGKLRFEASIGAFRDVEWKEGVEVDDTIQSIIESDRKSTKVPKPYSGIAF